MNLFKVYDAEEVYSLPIKIQTESDIFFPLTEQLLLDKKLVNNKLISLVSYTVTLGNYFDEHMDILNNVDSMYYLQDGYGLTVYFKIDSDEELTELNIEFNDEQFSLEITDNETEKFIISDTTIPVNFRNIKVSSAPKGSYTLVLKLEELEEE